MLLPASASRFLPFFLHCSTLLGILRGIWAVNTWTLQSTIFGAENLSKVAGFSQFGAGILILTLAPNVLLLKDLKFIPVVTGSGGNVVVALVQVVIAGFDNGDDNNYHHNENEKRKS